MIEFTKDDLFEVFYITEKETETDGTVFFIEYEDGNVAFNHLLLKKFIKEWGYKIVSECDVEGTEEDNYFGYTLRISTDFPYDEFKRHEQSHHQFNKSLD